MISFFVAGIPIPKGSAKAFHHKQSGKIIVQQDNRAKQKPWASLISSTAQDFFLEPLEGPVMISISFRMPRIKSHYRSGKNAHLLKEDAPQHHTSKPDVDKLLRLALDSLTGVAWKDDNQVAIVAHLSKKYGDRPGAFIQISEIKEGA